MDQSESKQNIYNKIFVIGDEATALTYQMMATFNDKNIRLKSLPPHQRIFIFFLTRAIKTFTAIQTLSSKGFGQDIATLLRSLLENLISVKYVLHDAKSADHKAARFVEYKWIVFKRYIVDTKETAEQIGDPLKRELILKKDLILEKIADFKKKFKITSDKALVTWSGRSVRDMAKMVNASLVEEYDLTFRLSSRFSHPSIIGDREYLNHQDEYMTFSPLPSPIGVHMNYEVAISYLIEFLDVFNKLFNLQQAGKLEKLKKDFADFQSDLKKDILISKNIPSTPHAKVEDPFLRFQIPSTSENPRR